MSSIYSTGGLKTPSFQTANKEDGGGNGQAGYDGPPQQQEPEYQPDFNFSRFRFGGMDLGDIPYTQPVFGPTSASLEVWKTAIANLLYQDVAKK